MNLVSLGRANLMPQTVNKPVGFYHKLEFHESHEVMDTVTIQMIKFFEVPDNRRRSIEGKQLKFRLECGLIKF